MSAAAETAAETGRSGVPTLAEHTTLRLGGPARDWVRVTGEQEFVETVFALDAAGEPVLVLGGGSNLVVADEGFDGTVVEVATRGIGADEDGCTGAIVRVEAGEDWDAFVAYAVEQEWSGIEMLSGIPGRLGATPIQNVGAYGGEVADTVQTVHAWDRRTRQRATFPLAACGFGYRTSRFKAKPGRYLITAVTFQFRMASRSAPIRYAELARTLGVDPGARPPAREVRDAVLRLRSGKGMVLDAADHDTWSAGSFFTNPVLSAADAERLPADAPRWPMPDDAVKTSAAWLIERAGFGRGFGAGPCRLSSKHTLALTNRGGATTEDLLSLARTIRDGVRQTYGVGLEPEPVLVGCAL
ncbi:UDP-N-acetylmuramate dehydrogenase [Microlunatus ginsengisoli]|uniref:UDP-N-acetylenolpyruvoylglucosamine reductase n=1 Tax=Microlunatus ginsengisoli TaxID=363863 RepID=A0ABP6ZU62_9ACTN